MEQKYLRYLDFDRSFQSCGLEMRKQELVSHLVSVLDQILVGSPPTNENAAHDFSIFSGTGGLVLVYLKLKRLLADSTLASLFPRDLQHYCASFAQYLPCSMQGVFANRGKFASREVTYHCGPPGTWLYNYLFYSDCCADLAKIKKNNMSETTVLNNSDDELAVRRQSLDSIVQIFPRVMSGQGLKSMESDIFYGRAGYLITVLAIWRLQEKEKESVVKDGELVEAVTDEMIIALVQVIVQDGRRHGKLGCPLSWSFNDTQYYGSAHGTCGILYHLLDALNALDEKRKRAKLAKKKRTRSENKKVKWGLSKSDRASILRDIDATIEHVIGLFELHENVPTDNSDQVFTEQVQFCHGCPGLIILLSRACLTFPHKQKKYLELARRCSEVVWQIGFLKKGAGLCHGISGNAYIFLMLHKWTKEEEYLQKAICFALNYFTHCNLMDDIPEYPYSLFEGLGGMACLLCDFLSAKNSFPAFEDLCIDANWQ